MTRSQKKMHQFLWWLVAPLVLGAFVLAHRYRPKVDPINSMERIHFHEHHGLHDHRGHQ